MSSINFGMKGPTRDMFSQLRASQQGQANAAQPVAAPVQPSMGGAADAVAQQRAQFSDVQNPSGFPSNASPMTIQKRNNIAGPPKQGGCDCG